MMSSPFPVPNANISRRAFMGIAGGFAAGSLVTLPHAAFGISPASAAPSRTTVEQYLGATRSALEELESHEADSYYLGTPYGTIGPGEFSPLLADWDCWHPNGKPAANGESYMNCTGFVVAVLEACGADCDIIGSYVDATGYDFGNKSNLSRWRHFFDEHASMRTRYESKEALLASGKLSKGDLIMAEPNDWGVNGADNHIMFFWGDSPNEDRAWHSSSKGNGVIAGKAPGNMISRITPKTADCYWLHVPLTNLIEVLLSKKSADASVSGESGANPAYALSGATFSIYRSFEGGELSGLITTFTTDKNGHASVELSPGDTVWINEDEPPKGFTAWDEPLSLTVGDSGGEVILKDVPCVVDVVVVKEDAETGPLAQGWATLEGAVYEIEDANGALHRAETAWVESLDGWAAVFKGLPLGTARIREVTPPRGYLLDASEEDGWHDLHLSSEAHEPVVSIRLDTHLETVIRGDIVGGKFEGEPSGEDESAKSPLAGCVFDIWLQDDGGLASRGYEVKPIVDAQGNPVMDEDGTALSGAYMGPIESHEDGRFDTRDLLDGWDPSEHNGVTAPEHALPYGTYVLIEASCPDPALRLVEPIRGIEIRAQSQEVFLMLEDKRITSPVCVRKIDKRSGLPILKPGTTVELLRKEEDGTYQRMEFDVHYPDNTTVSSFVIDEDGFIWFPAQLDWGTYAIRETKAVPPYLVANEAVEFVVDEHHDWGEGGIEITLADEAATGTIKGLKTDRENGQGVMGATYEVRAAYDVVMPDGEVVLAAGDVAGTATTDENGAWSIEGLPLGEGSVVYEIREIATPSGYVLDGTTHTVTLDYADGATPVVETQVAYEEAPTELIVKKTDTETGEGIEGVEFSVFLKDESPESAEGSKEPDDTEKGDEGEESSKTPIDGNEKASKAKAAESETPSIEHEPVAVTSTDANGEARFLYLANDATYLIRETSARNDLGYVLSNAETERYLSTDGTWHTSRKAYEAEGPDDHLETASVIEVTNDFTKVAIYKADADAWEQMTGSSDSAKESERAAAEQSALLNGGAFRLIGEDGGPIALPASHDAEDTWAAAGKQPQLFTHLPVGARLVVQEVAAPEGFSPGEEVEFTVEDTTEVQTVVVFNRKIESLPRTFDGKWRVAAGFGIAAAGGAAIAAYSRRRVQVERLSNLRLSK